MKKIIPGSGEMYVWISSCFPVYIFTRTVNPLPTFVVHHSHPFISSVKQIFPAEPHIPQTTSSRIGKRLRILRHGKPIPHIILLQPRHRLLQPLLTNRDLLHHTLQPLIRRQLQHLDRLLPIPNMTRPHQHPIADQILRVDPIARVFGHPHRDEVAVHVQQAEVFAQLEAFGGVGRVDDEVEGHLVGHLPVFVFCGDEALRAELFHVGFFGVRAGDGPGFGAERVGENDPVVANATHADDADLGVG